MASVRQKTFCVLEQGKSAGSKRTKIKKELFSTGFSDFYRLNWLTDQDPDADIVVKNCCWSEGRTALYEFVPKIYDFYVFIDDDITFESRRGAVAEQINTFFQFYRPISGCFFNKHSWEYRSDRDIFRWIVRWLLSLKTTAFPIMRFDLSCCFFSKSFADIVFPVPFHGSDGSLVYPQWICHSLYPRKQVCYTGVNVVNEDHLPHEDGISERSEHARQLVSLFNSLTLDHSYDLEKDWQKTETIKKNYSLIGRTADKTPTDVSIADLRKILDVAKLKERQNHPLDKDLVFGV